jgi:hypothetical protein
MEELCSTFEVRTKLRTENTKKEIFRIYQPQIENDHKMVQSFQDLNNRLVPFKFLLMEADSAISELKKEKDQRAKLEYQQKLLLNEASFLLF